MILRVTRFVNLLLVGLLAGLLVGLLMVEIALLDQQPDTRSIH
jgi:hypothetical protein